MLRFFIITSFASLAFLVLSLSTKKQIDDDPIERNFKTKYVVVMIIDGPRYTETFGDSTRQFIPKMANELMPQGVLYQNFRNNGPTYTNAGHTAITTGNYQSISNSGKELPKNPSMFQYYLKGKNADKTDAYIVSSKGKLEILTNTKNKNWWNTYMPSSYCGPLGHSNDYEGDPQTLNKVKELLDSEKPPHLMLINFLEVDSYGHSNQWINYLTAITKCDEYASVIWNKIQRNPILKDKTALIITSDHGRHLDGRKDGFVSHGDGCEGCRHINLLAMGPDFKKNVVFNQCREQLDISKTISIMMGFQMPSSKGKFMSEMFE